MQRCKTNQAAAVLANVIEQLCIYWKTQIILCEHAVRPWNNPYASWLGGCTGRKRCSISRDATYEWMDDSQG
eukprot:scaffold67351_cov19-Prasinocladus_malaysianus.AAC.2